MTKLGAWYSGYGVFLILCGVAGYLSNPVAAKTALISGGTFGSMMVLFGVLMRKGVSHVRGIALMVTLMLSAIFFWRAVVTLQKAAGGEPKVFAACLISAMFVASLLTVHQQMRARRAADPSEPRQA